MRVGVAVLASLSSSGLVAQVAAAPLYRQRILADGLANPRGLLIHGQHVLVSEAGSGRETGSSGSPCITPRPSVELCEGATGAIGSWNALTGSYSRLITGLPSLAQSDGSEGTGIADLTWHDSLGLVGVFGLGANPGMPAVQQLSPLFGQVVQIDLATQQLTPRSNLAAFEKTINPDGDIHDINSNPYGIQAFAGKLFATDAGGNTLLTIDPTSPQPDGSLPITNYFLFPKIPVIIEPPLSQIPTPFQASAVPTGLSLNDWNQKLQIGEFTGFPFAPGSATVFSLSAQPSATPIEQFSGLTLISDLAAGVDGSLYVLQYSSNYFEPSGAGSIWKLGPNGSRLQIITGLTHPTGLTVDANGILYVTNNADGSNGQLLRFDPVPGPLPLLGAWAAWSRSRRLRQQLGRAGRGGRG